MRVSLFVSALFAASLFAGGAMADRPGGDDGGRTTRMPPVREMRPVREVREVQIRPHETPQTRVRDPQVTERIRARGDMVDRYGAGPAAAAGKVQGEASIKAQRQAEKAREQLNARKNQVINCSATDDSCGASASAAAAAARAANQQAKAERDAAAKQRAEIQKKIDELRAQRMREKLLKQICEKKANMCSENL